MPSFYPLTLQRAKLEVRSRPSSHKICATRSYFDRKNTTGPLLTCGWVGVNLWGHAHILYSISMRDTFRDPLNHYTHDSVTKTCLLLSDSEISLNLAQSLGSSGVGSPGINVGMIHLTLSLYPPNSLSSETVSTMCEHRVFLIVHPAGDWAKSHYKSKDEFRHISSATRRLVTAKAAEAPSGAYMAPRGYQLHNPSSHSRLGYDYNTFKTSTEQSLPFVLVATNQANAYRQCHSTSLASERPL